ncbi:MAG: aldose 1-epimerase [Pirellulales bacterium]
MSIEQVTLVDSQTGASAKILVGFGFNCYEFKASVAGSPVDVLWSHPNFTSGTERPSHSGIPLLFPYPGRLKETVLTYGGKSYQLEGNDGRGNAIHGFCLTRPWRVTAQTSSSVTAEFQASVDDATILKKWPADFKIAVSYELKGNTLASRIVVTNPDDKPLPHGFGSHPYFRVPLGVGGSAESCKLTVPVRSYWELVDMLPSGKKLPAEGSRGLAAGMAFPDTKLDDVFSDVQFANHSSTATLADAKSGRKLEVVFDDQFSQVVVYNPPHREAVCIEPYTCVPDQFTMAARGVIPAVQTLAPGASHACGYEIRVS